MSTIAIDPVALRAQVLSDGRDDHMGLYEIVWSLNHRYPDLPRPAKVAAARAVTRELLAVGAIALFRTRWPSQDYEPIPHGEALRLVDSPASREDPTSEPYICYAAA